MFLFYTFQLLLTALPWEHHETVPKKQKNHQCTKINLQTINPRGYHKPKTVQQHQTITNLRHTVEFVVFQQTLALMTIHQTPSFRLMILFADFQ